MSSRQPTTTLARTVQPFVETLEGRTLMAGQVLFSENFEAGGRGWSVDTELAIDQRKAWSVTIGRGAHSGTRAAGTVNAGIDSVLASPAVALPGVNQYNEHLYLRWWQWSDYASRGGIAASSPVVREWQPALSSWGPWNVIDPNTETVPQQSKTWGHVGLDLTQFAGSVVQVGFHHYGNTNGAPGWFVDDVQIIREAVQRPWASDTGFENGFNSWTTTRGMWDIGTPGGGIATPGGSRVAGTGILTTPKAAETSSLISPAFYLPQNNARQPVTLQFKSFMDRAQAAIITVEFQFWMPSVGWSPVNNLSADLADTVLNIYQPIGQWRNFSLPITNSFGGAHTLPHRILFTASAGINGGRGWFIDDVKLSFPGKPNTPTPQPVRSPEVAVFNQFGELTDGVTAVNWGTYKRGTGGKDLVFTIRNTGGAPLSIGKVFLDNNAGFTVVQQPAATIAAGGFTTFRIRMLTDTIGTKSAAVRFATNDLNESTFNFRISGHVVA